MKYILLLFTFLCLINPTFGQLTFSSVEGVSPGRNLTYKNPITNSTETRFIGMIYGKIGNPHTGSDACYYSYDMIKPGSGCMPNYEYVDDSTTQALPKVIYIVYNYYPGATGPGQLSNLNNETAAIQAVIWHYTNGLDLNTITSTTVRNRALAIYANVEANGGSASVPQVLKIVPDIDPDYFMVQTLSDNNQGIAVNNILLSISQGSLSDTSVNTALPNGLSSPVQVIGTGSGTITAIATDIPLPKGLIFRQINNQCPKMVLACPGPGSLRITFDWGALPVEMISFNATVNSRNVTLSWTTGSELNNKGFEIERQLSGSEWTSAGFVNGNGTVATPTSYTFTDRNLASGRYSYRLKQIDYNGNFEYFNLSNLVSIGEPVSFSVSQNYPNPFNPSTKINYDLPVDGTVSIKVFDITGKEVINLFSGNKSAGFYTETINAENLSSGIYFYRVNLTSGSNNFMITKKMNVVK